MSSKQSMLTSLFIGGFLALLLQSTPVVCAEEVGSSSNSAHSIEEIKDWTVIVFMAADNDLRGFAARNIKQMAAVGSNKFVNIVTHLDIRISGNKKITRRYYIEKNRILHVNADDPLTQKMDSGDPETLISCCAWAIKNYPARNYALIFWNHGTGPLDPAGGRIINPTELFTFNPAINKFELDRTIGFMDHIQAHDAQRGICWDDSTGNYLTNQKLTAALAAIKERCLHGKKFSIIGFDACLMSTLEIASHVKPYADVMVGSQEVELGTGWNYQRALGPFQTNTVTPQEFAQNIVTTYGATYANITNDYTQSAIDLRDIALLENNINTVATMLITGLTQQANNSVRNVIQASRNKDFCTHFDEPSYLDMHHLYSNLYANVAHCSFANPADEVAFKTRLSELLTEGMRLIKKSAVANIAGKNLRLAQGISLYFPERKMHYSYKKTAFALTNNWGNFLQQYLG